MELTRPERRERVKAFHAHIARQAALVARKQDCTYFISNVPFGAVKVAPPEPPRQIAPQSRNPEPDHWPSMWFYDLVFGQATPKIFRVEDIYRAVAIEYGVTRLDLTSQRRTANIVLPRQVAFYLAKILTGRSLPELGRRMGGRDHTTALHGIRKIERLVETDAELAARIEKIKASL